MTPELDIISIVIYLYDGKIVTAANELTNLYKYIYLCLLCSSVLQKMKTRKQILTNNRNAN